MLKYLIAFLFSFSVEARQLHIAIIDSGLPKGQISLKVCPKGTYDLTNTDMIDRLDHGTVIAGIIGDKLKDIDYCAYVFKIYDKDKANFFNYETAMLMLYHMRVDVINYSSSGGGGPFIEEEMLLNGLIRNGVKFVSSAGNNGKDLDENCDIYPACYANVISVGNGADNHVRAPSSNYGNRITVWRKGNNIRANGITMSGTSMSAAAYSADLILEMSKRE